MDVFVFYAAATAVWCGIQGGTLALAPRLICTVLKTEYAHATALEQYLCESLGVTLLALGLLSAMMTGLVPLNASMAAQQTPSADQRASPYLVPTLWITLLYHGASCCLMYVTAMHMGHALHIGACISGALALVGAWCGLFATPEGVVSRSSVFGDGEERGTGKSRMSGYPFKNQVRDEAKRK